MATVRLLIDEDVRPLLAETLRQRGFDAKHVDELKRSGLSDPEQLAFAVKQRRAEQFQHDGGRLARTVSRLMTDIQD
jgi:hypothetical protein